LDAASDNTAIEVDNAARGHGLIDGAITPHFERGPIAAGDLSRAFTW